MSSRDRGDGEEGSAPAPARSADSLNLPAARRAFWASKRAEERSARGATVPEPVASDAVVTLAGATDGERRRWGETGLAAIAEGKVGAVLLAGGQGTRLGSALPKGCYDIGLPSGKPLFQLHAERLSKLQRLAADHAFGKGHAPRRPIHWYVMTSPATHRDTVDAFEQSGFFGLDPEQVHLFEQGTLPCMTEDGTAILEAPWKVARNPDGNGGLYEALGRAGLLAQMAECGVEGVDVCSVDNALARVCDPAFVGCCLERGAQLGARVVAKAGPGEKVGVLVRGGGGLAVAEYTELGEELAAARDEDGELRYRWGNICMHYMARAFLEQCAGGSGGAAAEYHIARKAIPSVGGPVQGVKLERFIFDPFPSASSAVLFEVDRAAEFAPVKNAPGAEVDSPGTARAMVLALHQRWVEAAGGSVEPAETRLPGQAGGGVEVAPTLSYGGEGLEDVCRNQRFAEGAHVSGRNWLRSNSVVARQLKGALDTPLKSNRASRAASRAPSVGGGEGQKEPEV